MSCAEARFTLLHKPCLSACAKQKGHRPFELASCPSGPGWTPSAWTQPLKRAQLNIYVVELSSDVLGELGFRKCKSHFREVMPCVYVGMTGLDPDVRFDKHKAGIQANRYVTQYGLRLLPDLYEGFNPMGYEDAVDKEIEVGIDLRSAGFGVWQA